MVWEQGLERKEGCSSREDGGREQQQTGEGRGKDEFSIAEVGLHVRGAGGDPPGLHRAYIRLAASTAAAN